LTHIDGYLLGQTLSNEQAQDANGQLFLKLAGELP
jgi:hypothetical protein